MQHVRKHLHSADTISLKTHRACQGSNLECLLVFFSGKQQQDITKGQKHGHGCQFITKIHKLLALEVSMKGKSVYAQFQTRAP